MSGDRFAEEDPASQAYRPILGFGRSVAAAQPLME